MAGKSFKNTNVLSSIQNKNANLELTKITEQNVPDTLSELEKQIEILSKGVGSYGWLIGQRLTIIREKKLYRNLDYKNFTDYLNGRNFGMSVSSAYNLMRIYSVFSFDQIMRYGSKLYPLLPLTDPIRLKALTWLEEENPSYQQVTDYVKNLQIAPVKTPVKTTINKKRLNIPIFEIWGFEIDSSKEDEILADIRKLLKDKYALPQ
jgi:hypothetical protein